MNPTEAVSKLVSYLDGNLSMPVRTGGMEGERPVPVVIVEDWEMNQLNHHNSQFVGDTYDVDSDDDGETEFTKWYKFYYEMRVEIVVRDADDVGAHEKLGSLQSALRDVEIDHSKLHHTCNDFKLGTSGSPSYQYLEPTETELTQSLSLTAFHQVSRSDFDSIESIQETFNLS
jgi:hypothetical protein